MFCKDGDKISFKNDNLIIKDKEQVTKLQVTCYQLFAIFVVGNFVLTSGIIERSKRFGFSIVLLSYSHKVYESITCDTKGNFLLREKQYILENSCGIAKHIVYNKISNQLQLLTHLRKEQGRDEHAIEQVKNYLIEVNNISTDNNMQTLLGWEGISSKIYFRALFNFFRLEGEKT